MYMNVMLPCKFGPTSYTLSIRKRSISGKHGLDPHQGNARQQAGSVACAQPLHAQEQVCVDLDLRARALASHMDGSSAAPAEEDVPLVERGRRSDLATHGNGTGRIA